MFLKFFFLHPSLQKMKRREGYKIFGLGGSLGVFVNIFFLLLDRMFWRAKGSHWAYPTPARTWKIGCHLVKFSSHPKKMWQARAKMNILPYLLKYINSIEQHSPAVYIFMIWLQYHHIKIIYLHEEYCLLVVSDYKIPVMPYLLITTWCHQCAILNYNPMSLMWLRSIQSNVIVVL